VPFRSALTAFFVVQVSVVLPPGATEVGLALIPAAVAPSVVSPGCCIGQAIMETLNAEAANLII
jgi:hypothetical protein